jgi:hypothetical protein
MGDGNALKDRSFADGWRTVQIDPKPSCGHWFGSAFLRLNRSLQINARLTRFVLCFVLCNELVLIAGWVCTDPSDAFGRGRT